MDNNKIQVFKVHKATDDKIILLDDKQLESLFQEISNDQNFMVQWIEGNDKRTKLFLADGLLARLKDGRLILEAKKEIDEEEDEGDRDQ